jgi:hypothetical protein
MVKHDAAYHHFLRVGESLLQFGAPLELGWFEISCGVEWLHDVCCSWEECSVVVDHPAESERLLRCGWFREVGDGFDFVA